MDTCPVCKREVPSSNAALHVLRCPGPPKPEEQELSEISSPPYDDPAPVLPSAPPLPLPSAPSAPPLPSAPPASSFSASSAPQPPPMYEPAPSPSSAAHWRCSNCTFLNAFPELRECEMCMHPREGLPPPPDPGPDPSVRAPLPDVREQLIPDFNEPLPPPRDLPRRRWSEEKVRMVVSDQPPASPSQGMLGLLAGSALGGLLGGVGALWTGRKVDTGIQQGVFVGGLLASAATSVSRFYNGTTSSPSSSSSQAQYYRQPGGQPYSYAQLSRHFPSPSAPPETPRPASVLAALPTHSVAGGPPFLTCSICLATCEPGQVVRTLPCFHMFHSQCVDPWLSKEPTCPNCKFHIE